MLKDVVWPYILLVVELFNVVDPNKVQGAIPIQNDCIEVDSEFVDKDLYVKHTNSMLRYAVAGKRNASQEQRNQLESIIHRFLEHEKTVLKWEPQGDKQEIRRLQDYATMCMVDSELSVLRHAGLRDMYDIASRFFANMPVKQITLPASECNVANSYAAPQFTSEITENCDNDLMTDEALDEITQLERPSEIPPPPPTRIPNPIQRRGKNASHIAYMKVVAAKGKGKGKRGIVPCISNHDQPSGADTDSDRDDDDECDSDSNSNNNVLMQGPGCKGIPMLLGKGKRKLFSCPLSPVSCSSQDLNSTVDSQEFKRPRQETTREKNERLKKASQRHRRREVRQKRKNKPRKIMENPTWTYMNIVYYLIRKHNIGDMDEVRELRFCKFIKTRLVAPAMDDPVFSLILPAEPTAVYKKFMGPFQRQTSGCSQYQPWDKPDELFGKLQVLYAKSLQQQAV